MNGMSQSRFSGHGVFALFGRHPVLVVAAVWLLTLSVLPRDAFWIADNDNKYLQMQAMIEQGVGDPAIPWPGRIVDPEFRFNPLPAPFSQVSDGRLYTIFSPVFAALSTIPYRLFGFWGLYLMPFAGGIATLLGIGRLGRLAGLDGRMTAGAVLIAGLATPLWFYSVLYWEHTIAAAFSVWAVVFLTAYAGTSTFRHLAVMSVLAAAGVYFRDELYLFCAVLAVMAAWLAPGVARRRVFFQVSALMAAALVPLWLYQWRAAGQPFGFHLGVHLFSAGGITAHIISRPQVLYNLLLAAHPNAVVSVLVSAPWVVLLLVPARYTGGRIRVAAGCAAAGGLVLAVTVCAGFLSSPGPIVWLLGTNSLLTAAPVLVLAAVPGQAGQRRALDIVRTVTAVYLAVYVLAAPEMGSSGIHWGNRFMLVLYPLMALSAMPAAAGLVRDAGKWRGAATAAVLMLVAASLAAQVYSIGLIGTKKDFNRRLAAAVALRPERVVVTDVWWAPQALSRVFYERQIFYAPGQEALQELGSRLVGTGTTAVLYIAAAGDRAAPSGAVRVGDGGLGFFSLDLVPLTLRANETNGSR